MEFGFEQEAVVSTQSTGRSRNFEERHLKKLSMSNSFIPQGNLLVDYLKGFLGTTFWGQKAEGGLSICITTIQTCEHLSFVSMVEENLVSTIAQEIRRSFVDSNHSTLIYNLEHMDEFQKLSREGLNS
eukprot:TRINITY_DN1450_c0_g1_i2.p1 TRINITY_DN1450_c0_g1~~TRINITY_DN1450_c0_g1_i2.p1  ORF type:complete len:128 (+),score=24.50 TRINITY_DN1450_c0_g1_i2:3-386(+)